MRTNLQITVRLTTRIIEVGGILDAARQAMTAKDYPKVKRLAEQASRMTREIAVLEWVLSNE